MLLSVETEENGLERGRRGSAGQAVAFTCMDMPLRPRTQTSSPAHSCVGLQRLPGPGVSQRPVLVTCSFLGWNFAALPWSQLHVCKTRLDEPLFWKG